MLKVVIKVDLSRYIIDIMDVYYAPIDINLENILTAVSCELEIPILYIKSKGRISRVPDARKLYCFLAREYTNESLYNIGKLINRDHSTVIWASRKAKVFIQNELEFKITYDSVKKRLKLK